MNELSNEYIEDAFSKVGANLEKRNNITGLEILDSYEENWTAHGSLTDRQITWLEKQLDGSWMQKAEPATKLIDGGAPMEKGAGIIQFPAMDRDLERRVDAMASPFSIPSERCRVRLLLFGPPPNLGERT